jgi:hypothetical protein
MSMPYLFKKHKTPFKKRRDLAVECRWTSTSMTDSSWDKALSRTQWELSSIVVPTPQKQRAERF